jgi:hypothetical protein
MRIACLASSAALLGASACELLVDTGGLHQSTPSLAGDSGDVAGDSGDVAGDSGDMADASSDAAASCVEPNAWTVDGHCYFILAKNTQPLAKAACVSVQAHLVTVNTAAEHEAMVAHVDCDAWIGLEAPPGTNQKADFSWITGEPKTVDYWDRADEATGCVVYAHDSHKWADRACDILYCTLCERP